MKTVPSFAIYMENEDFMFSFDINSDYQHFSLHLDMRDYFLFHYNGRLFRCITLPFSWGRSTMWFTKMLRTVVRYMRNMW